MSDLSREDIDQVLHELKRIGDALEVLAVQVTHGSYSPESEPARNYARDLLKTLRQSDPRF